MTNATTKLFKVKARTAWDYVEVGGYKTFNQALISLYQDFYGYRNAFEATKDLKKEFKEAEKNQTHHLIEEYYI